VHGAKSRHFHVLLRGSFQRFALKIPFIAFDFGLCVTVALDNTIFRINARDGDIEIGRLLLDEMFHGEIPDTDQNVHAKKREPKQVEKVGKDRRGNGKQRREVQRGKAESGEATCEYITADSAVGKRRSRSRQK
jgi:hypothetical protein